MARWLPLSLARLLHSAADRVPDADLLRRFAADRDEAAFAALVDRHGPMVLAVCRRATGDEHRAEDVFQSVFLVLAQKAGRLSRPDRLAGWLFGVARTLGRKAARRAAGAREREARVAAGAATETDLRSAGENLLRELDTELGRLPEEERVPLVLCYLEGRTQDEAARACGWSLRTLRRRLAAGRTRLRERLERKGATLAGALAALAVAPSAGSAVGTQLRQLTMGALSAWAAREGATALGAGGAAVRKLTRWVAVLAVAGGLVAGGVWVWEEFRDRGPADHPAGPLADSEPSPQTDDLAQPVLRFKNDQVSDRWPRSIRYAADGTRLITVGDKLRTWDGTPLRPQGEFSPQPPKGRKLWFDDFILAPDGKTVVGFGDGEGRQFVSELGRKPVSIGVWDWGGPEPKVVFEKVLLDWYGHPHHAFSPDGRRLAVVGSDEIVVLELTSGVVLSRHGRGNTNDAIQRVWFSGDGRSVYLLDGTAPASRPDDDRHWDYKVTRWYYGILRGKVSPVRVATVPDVPTGQLDVSPDGKWLVASRQRSESFSFQLIVGSGNSVGRTQPTREVHVWDLSTGKKVGSFDAGAGVWRLWFGADGTAWALTRDGQRGPYAVSRWEVPSGKCILDSPARVPVDGVFAVSPDGRTFAVTDSGAVRRWDLATGRAIDPEPVAQPGVWASFSSDGGELLQWDRAGVRRWDASTGRPLPERRTVEFPLLGRIYPDPTGLVVAAEFVPETGRHDLSVWGIEREQKVADLGPQADRYPNGYVVSVAVSPDRRWVVVWGAADTNNGYLRRWDLDTGRLVWDVRVTNAEHSREVTVAPDGKTVYLGTGHLFGIDADTGRERFRRFAVAVPDDWRKDWAWHRFLWAGGRMVQLARGRGIIVFNPDTGKLDRLVDVPGAWLIETSADGRRLVALCHGPQPVVRVYDTATWQQVWAGAVTPGAVPEALHFSPDSQRLLVACWSGPVAAELFAVPK